MNKALRNFLIYNSIVLLLSVIYFVYAYSAHPPSPERETFLSEAGESIGEVAMWIFIFIYLRTVLKLIMGKGPIARRLLPAYTAPKQVSHLQKIMVYLDRSHIYVGIAGLALTLLHIALMGLHPEILFFPLVLALIIWQGAFGMVLSWRRAPGKAKRWSYSIHVQLIIGVFAYFGHILIDN